MSRRRRQARLAQNQVAQKNTAFRLNFERYRAKVWRQKNARVRLHHSFRRSYREDYVRPLSAPGLLAHAVNALKIIFKNWRLFGLLLLFIVFANIFLVGIMSEDTYTAVQDSLDESYSALKSGELGRLAKSAMLVVSTVSTGGLSRGLSEVQQVFAGFLFALVWLISIYFLRHLLAGHKVRFRDGLFNALTPLISVFVCLFILFIHAIPILFFIIAYSTAIATDFLSQPLYAFLFWLFGGLLLLLSAYLLPVSLLALLAVTAPGVYPAPALAAATDLIQGRRTKFIIRFVFMFLFLAVIWVAVMLPLTWLDLLLKNMNDFFQGFPFIPLCLQLMTVFSFIYISTYMYLFYRRMLDDATTR